jgi:glycosyltransferase involved in cell wall biosynthesis
VGRRILLLITDLEIGGTPTVVRELAVRLNQPPDISVDVACLSRAGPVSAQIESAGIRATALNATGASDLSAIARLARLIRDGQFDTVFSFLIHANAAAAVATRFSQGVRLFQSVQTTQPNPRWHWKLQSMVQHSAERIVVPSPSVARAAQDWADEPREKITTIPNAIDLRVFPLATGLQSVRATHGLQPRAAGEPIPIGFIGRLDPIKRVPDLVHALRMLEWKVHLHVFGEGSERPRIESVIRELALSDRVTLHGSVARPEDALRNIELLVLPSAAEGFGLVLIEAMAAGVPVVATDVPGIRDVVRSGQTGLLVQPGSPRELARAIDRVIGTPELRDRLVRAAMEDVSRRFTWEVVLPRYRELLGIATLPRQPQDAHS